jgi:hypothetical protein
MNETLEPEPTRSQKLRDAGYTARTKGWDKEVDEQAEEALKQLNTEETV